jgi:hypothetical protein
MPATTFSLHAASMSALSHVVWSEQSSGVETGASSGSSSTIVDGNGAQTTPADLRLSRIEIEDQGALPEHYEEYHAAIRRSGSETQLSEAFGVCDSN